MIFLNCVKRLDAMEDNISYKDLFDLEDDKDLKQAIKVIEKLDTVYENLIKNQTKLKDKYKSNIDELVKSTNELMKATEKIDPTTKEGQKNLSEMAKASDMAAEKYGQLNKKVVTLEGTIGQLSKEQVEFNKAQERSLEINKEKERLDKKLSKLNDEQAQDIAKVRLQIQERNKELKESAKESLGLVSIYQKESKRLNDLRKQYKNVALSQGASSKEAKELLNQVTELDGRLKEVDANAGQFQRNVGNYPEIFQSIGGAAEGAVPGIGAANTALNTLRANPIVFVVTALIAGLMGLFKAFKKTTFGADFLNDALAVINNTFGTFVSQIGRLLTGELKLRDFFSDTKEQIIDNANATLQLERARRRLEKTTADNALAEAQLGEEIARLEGIRDNDARSLDQRRKAAELLAKALVQEAEIRKRTVDEEVEIARLAVEAAAEGSVQKRDAEYAYTQALAEQSRARAEIIRAEADARKELEMIKLDLFEQELDLLIDINDRNKQVNERRIKDDKLALSKRIELAKENQKIVQESFNQQIATFEKYFDVQLDANELLGKSGAEVLEYARSLGLSERATNRLREVVIEKSAADQDNIETVKELNKEIPKVSATMEREAIKIPKITRDVVKNGLESMLKGTVDTAAIMAKIARDTVVDILDTTQDKVNTYGTAIIDLIGGLNQRAIQKDEERLEILERNKERELSAAGDNANRRAQIEERYNARIDALDERARQRKRRQAEFEKALNVTNSIINTARAVTQSLPNVPLAIAVGALGAIQTAAILATPIPRFFKGTDNAPGGAAWIGDGGKQELVMEPTGRTYLSPDKPTLVDLPKGSRVFNGLDTERMLRGGEIQRGQNDSNRIKQGLTRDRAAVAMEQARIMGQSNANLGKDIKDGLKERPQHFWKVKNNELVQVVRDGNTTYDDWDKVNSYE